MQVIPDGRIAPATGIAIWKTNPPTGQQFRPDALRLALTDAAQFDGKRLIRHKNPAIVWPPWISAAIDGKRKSNPIYLETWKA